MTNSMQSSIERLAVGTWKRSKSQAEWSAAHWQFFGMYRLAMWQENYSAAQSAETVADLALYRSLIS